MKDTTITKTIFNGMSKQEAINTLEYDFDRFPLPLCFERSEEQRAMYSRRIKIIDVVERLFSLYKLTN